jgi:predicted membrane chloride channel (bestrophin family)
MIVYNKTMWGLPLLTRIEGSALPRSLVPAAVSGALTAVLLLLQENVSDWWAHPYAYQSFSFVVAFVITFRSTFAYQRHWEAAGHMQSLTGNLQHAASLVRVASVGVHQHQHREEAERCASACMQLQSTRNILSQRAQVRCCATMPL